MQFIQPASFGSGDTRCFDSGSGSWRTSEDLDGSAASATGTDSWDLVPSVSTVGTHNGSVQFAIGCGVSTINFTITFDRDGGDTNCYLKAYTDSSYMTMGTEDAGTEEVSLTSTAPIPDTDTRDEDDWLLAAGQTLSGSFNVSYNPCGAFVKFEGQMEVPNPSQGDVYLNLSVTTS